MGETPFAHAFDTKAVITLKVDVSSYMTSQTITKENNWALSVELDLLEERRLTSDLQNTTYKRSIKKYYNSKVKTCKFKVGYLILWQTLGVQKGVFGQT